MCTCQSDNEVHCRQLDNSTTQVPVGFPNGTRKLYVTNSGINNLDNDPFSELVHLQELHLDGNNISFFPRGVFRNLKSAHQITLRGNEIRTLNANFIEGLENLQSLDLSNNQLISWHDMTFRGAANLRRLNLQNNTLTYLPGRADGLKHLLEVKLEGNNISCSCDLYILKHYYKVRVSGTCTHNNNTSTNTLDIDELTEEQCQDGMYRIVLLT